MRTAQLCREFDLTARHIVFPLHPDTPDAGQSLDDLFAGRYDMDVVRTRLRRVAEELNLPLGDRTHTYNSRRAQELGKWAERQGRGDEFRDAVYRAYFAEAQNIADIKVLTGIAERIGLDAVEAKQVLRDERFAATVDADWERAGALGVTAVPTVIYGSRRLVGFRPYEDFRDLLTG